MDQQNDEQDLPLDSSISAVDINAAEIEIQEEEEEEKQNDNEEQVNNVRDSRDSGQGRLVQSLQ